jgi:hypothetical protein
MHLVSHTGERKKSTAFRGIGSTGSFAAVRLRTVMFGHEQAADLGEPGNLPFGENYAGVFG